MTADDDYQTGSNSSASVTFGTVSATVITPFVAGSSAPGVVELTRTDTTGTLTVYYSGSDWYYGNFNDSYTFTNNQGTHDIDLYGPSTWPGYATYAWLNVSGGVGYVPDSQAALAMLAPPPASPVTIPGESGPVTETVGSLSATTVDLDDTTPVQFTVSFANVPTGGGTQQLFACFSLGGTAVAGADYTVTLDGASRTYVGGDDGWVDYTGSQPWFGGITYCESSALIWFGAGETSATLDITPIEANGRFGDKTVTVTPLGGQVPFCLLWTPGPIAFDNTDPPQVLTLVDDRPKVAIGDAVAGEGDAETFKVGVAYSPWASSGGSAILDYQTQDGTSYGGLGGVATAWTDYTAASGQLAISSSQTTQTVTVQTELDGNAVDGSDLSFSVVLTDPGTSNTPPGPGTLQFVNSTGAGEIDEFEIYLTDAEYPNQNVTGTDPVGVRVGETVTLTALVNGYPDQMVNWTLPGNGEVIQSYDPTKPANQLTPLGQAGQGSDAGYQVVQDESHITFEWVGAGAFYVSATVANQGSTSTTVNSGFFVQAPNVTVTAKTLSVPNTPTSHYKNGTVTSVDPGDPHDGSLQMAPLTATANEPTGWKYCFLQTIIVDGRAGLPRTSPLAAQLFTVGMYHVKGTGLDTSFPYPGPSATYVDAPVIPWCEGDVSELTVSATTYYMCQPVDTAGNVVGGWVPVAVLTWSYCVDGGFWYQNTSFAKLFPGSSVITVSGKRVPDGRTYTGTFDTFDPAVNAFPAWSTIVSAKSLETKGGAKWERDIIRNGNLHLRDE